MTLSYAFFTDGRASGIPIALWTCHYRQGTLQRKFELGFAPIEGAYVACVQVSEGRASIAVRPELIRYGRTNRWGWVVRRERHDLGAENEVPESRPPLVDPPPTWFMQSDPVFFDVPDRRADPTLLYGLPNERYRIFWTYSSDLFEHFLQELDADPQAALDARGVPHYTMEPFGTPAPFGGLALMNDWERGAASRLLFPGERRGYHAGWYFKDKFTPAIFDATPECFRALFASEWLQWCCERVVHDDPDWPYLWSLAAVIRTAESGAPIPDLAKELPHGGEMGERAKQMRAYVYACAKLGIRERDRVLNAIHVSVGPGAEGPSGWRAAAAYIEDNVGLIHPAMAHETHLDQFFFTETVKDALLAYFDMYALGFRNRKDAVPIAAHAAQVQDALGWVRSKQEILLSSIHDDQFMRALALHVELPDISRRLELLDRLHFQCANAELPFWEKADAKLATQDAWDRMVPYLAWLGEGSDLLAEMLEGLLERYVPAYRLRAESAETLVRYLYRYQLALEGRRADQTLPHATGKVRLEYDPAKNRAVAKLYIGAQARPLGEYELLTRVTSAPAGEAHAPLGPTASRDQLKLFRRAMKKGQVREFVLAERALEVPHGEALAGLPKLLASSAALIKAGLAVRALAQECKGQKLGDVPFDLYLEVAEESLQALEPGSEILQSVFAKAGMGASKAASHPFVRGGAALAKLGTLIESSRNLIAGSQTLATLIAPTRSSTDLANYLDRGETVPAWLEGTKGVVQVASGAAGVGSLVLGASMTLAAIPLSAWVAVGLVAVATLDVLIYAKTGGGSPVDEFLTKVRLARSKQLKLSTEDRILMPGEEVVPGEVDPGSGGRASTATCRLARKLGALNEIAKDARVG